MRLDDLGSRICILGPSNSGKSTLACAIGRARALDVVHLDLLYHRPGTDWDARPELEFQALHDRAILSEGWVMDGNYTRYLPQRLACATGVILLDVSTPISLVRYIRRTLFERGQRAGALPGGRDSLKWTMIRHIAGVQRRNRARYAERFGQLALPKIALSSRRAVQAFYGVEGLSRTTHDGVDRDSGAVVSGRGLS